MEQSMASVMRNINDALRLDNDSNDKEAYMKYLDCILCITCNLQQSVRDKGWDVITSKEISKQVKLAQQCIERVSVIVDKLGSSQRPIVLQFKEVKPFIAVPPLLSLESTANTFTRTQGISPMEAAYKRNQQLMSAYRARMARMNKGDPGAFNLNLSIQRKIAENLAIARKTEEALAKKMQERQERLEVQAVRRFATPTGMSKEEQEQRQIYKKILEYEQDAKWLQNWRIKLESNLQEPEVICQLIQEILRCIDHPLTLLIKEYQRKIYEKIYRIVVNKKDRLAAIKVPLDPALWPVDFCNLEVIDVLGKMESAEGNELDNGKQQEGKMFATVEEKGESEYRTAEDQSKIMTRGEKDESLHNSGAFHHPLETEDAEFTVCVSPSRTGTSYASSDKNPRETQSPFGGEEKFGESVHHSISMLDNRENTTDSQVVQNKDCVDAHKNTENSDVEHISKSLNSNNNLEAENDKILNEAVPADDSSEKDKEDFSEREDLELKAPNENNSQSLNLGQNLEAEVIPVDDSEKDKEELESRAQNKKEGTKNAEDDCGDSVSVFTFTEDTRAQMDSAIENGENLQSHLTQEQARAVRILQRISEDYEKYNAENMDDLFDDDDDEEENLGSSFLSKDDLWKGESDQPSFVNSNSLRGSESLVSRSSSGGSIHDFTAPALDNSKKVEIERLSKEAYLRHAKNISADVHMYIEKLLVMFTIAYEQLDCPLGRDQCYVSLEETFFKPLWKYLLMLFRLSHYKEELSLAYKMTQNANISPQEIGVPQKLCLQFSDGKQGVTSPPYQQAITQLSCIKDHYTMLSKLECIVKTVHFVCDCVKDFYKSQGFKAKDIPSVGADDLLPVITYIVIKSRLPQLVSECHAMSEFIHEGYIMGQEGYCLTTLETAVSYLVSADLNHPCSP